MVEITKVSSLSNLGSTSGTKITPGTSEAGTDTSTGTSKADDLKNQFLSILLTQMQHQNPLDPMDTKEFTGQLAQFSALEQQIDTNSKLDKMVTAMQSNASTAAFGYIGQDAEINSKTTLVEDGTADWNYSLAGNAANVSIKIKDQSGKVVFEEEIKNVQSGTYSLNAKLADFESDVAEGQILTLDIKATSESDTAVATNISTKVRVDGVETSANGVNLRSGGLLFGLTNVLRFTSTTAPLTATAPSTGTTPATTTAEDETETTEPAAAAA